MNLVTYKSMGTIYKILPTEFTAKGFPKRAMLLEIPVLNAGTQSSTVIKFMVLGDETASLDYYNPGDFVEILFKLDGFFWKMPETGEKIHLQSLKIVDIHKRHNPFKTGEEIKDKPDDLSPDAVAELATNVKDYINEPHKRDTLFDDDGNFNNDGDGLPF